jgi:hypothetical protein
MPTNKPTNPWGCYGDAMEPRAKKHSGPKTKYVLSLGVSPQDTEDWAQRVFYVDRAMMAINTHVEKDKSVKFIKRKFVLQAVEAHIAKFLADNPDVIVK